MAPSSPRQSGHAVFEILVSEHADMLAAYLRSLVSDRIVVDDLFQDTMMIAWRRLDDFDRTRSFGPWLRGIARNLVLEHRRRCAGRGMLNCDPQVLEAIEAHFQHVDRAGGDSFRERVHRLPGCLQQLPDKLREVVDLAYGRDLRLGQIAESLHTNEEAIKKRAQRARRMLLDCMMARTET